MHKNEKTCLLVMYSCQHRRRRRLYVRALLGCVGLSLKESSGSAGPCYFLFLSFPSFFHRYRCLDFDVFFQRRVMVKPANLLNI